MSSEKGGVALALVPSWQCGQSFYAPCHDASYFDALCPYRAFAEPAEPAAYVEPATNAPPPAPNPPLHTTTGANAPPLSPAVPRDSVHAPHSASSASPSSSRTVARCRSCTRRCHDRADRAQTIVAWRGLAADGSWAEATAAVEERVATRGDRRRGTAERWGRTS